MKLSKSDYNVVKRQGFPNAPVHMPFDKIDNGFTQCGVKIAFDWALTDVAVTCKNCIRVMEA